MAEKGKSKNETDSQFQKAIQREMERVKEDLRAFVKEQISSTSAKPAFKSQTHELEEPPLPTREKGGRKHVVMREKLSGTADKTLMEMFEQERTRRGMTVSRMIDMVLWHYFGRPKLSFEQSPRIAEDSSSE